jgi:hypothetical protein
MVEHRRVNDRIILSVFLLPRGGDDQKVAFAPGVMSMLDAASGFDHFVGHLTSQLTCRWILVFPKATHNTFCRHLWAGWFVYIDDLARAAGSVVAGLRALTAGKVAAEGLAGAAGARRFFQPVAQRVTILMHMIMAFEHAFVYDAAACSLFLAAAQTCCFRVVQCGCFLMHSCTHDYWDRLAETLHVFQPSDFEVVPC